MQFVEDHEKSARGWYGGAVGLVAFDGSLNTLSQRAGFAAVPAAGRLFFFGGRGPNEKKDAGSAVIQAAEPALSAWANEGLQLTTERYLPGTAVQSAFIFIIGGQNASNVIDGSVDRIVW